MAGFHIEHFGCRAARADGEAVGGWLRAAGLDERSEAVSDVVVVNTCSVTAEADRAARAFIRRTHRLNPDARIVVTGCYAQRAPEELAALAGVAAVVGNSHKAMAPEIILGLAGAGTWAGSRAETVAVEGPIPSGELEKHSPKAKGAEERLEPGMVSVPSLMAGGIPIWADDRFAHSFIDEGQLEPGTQTRPNLKIQEGCGNRCTFCVIPQTRGSSRSLPVARVLKQVEGFVAAGGNELVLSGINLGRWGWDLAGLAGESELDLLAPSRSGKDNVPKNGRGGVPAVPPFPQKEAERTGHGATLLDARSFWNGARRSVAGLRLAGLARWILEESGLPRLRLSSIEPMDWDGELIGLMAEFGGLRLARHAHLPLQSGSDAVLRRMHRRYRPWHYVDKVEALVRAAGRELTLGADVMVGFPGETDGEFEETMEMVRALPFGYLHLFPFSPRPGTRCWALHAETPVATAAVEERMTALRGLAAEKSRAHREQFVGREVEAITLHTPAAMAARGRTAALTENFLAVEMAGQLEANRLVRVRVTGLNAEGALAGEFAAADSMV